MESTYLDTLYTIRWFISNKWRNLASKSSAISAVSDALSKAPSPEVSEILYTIRWYFSEKWGDKVSKIDVYDLITELIEGDAHIDSDRTPNPKEHEGIVDEPPVANIGYRKVALVVGHNQFTGARSHDGDDEWTTRNEVAKITQKKLKNLGYSCKIFYRDRSLSYGDAMRKHGRDIDDFGADIAIELHFNSATPSATGMEMIVCSEYSEKVFEPFVKKFHSFYPEVPIRRTNGILLREYGRGAGFCRAPKCPAGVWEPCFASNPSEWEKFDGKVGKEAISLVQSIQVALDNIS